jgi:glutaredoxin 3
MKKIIIYSKIPCPYCVSAKKFFSERKIPFEEIDLTGKYDELSKLVERTNHRTVPQIFIGETFIGGFDDLIKLNEKGALEPLLK